MKICQLDNWWVGQIITQPRPIFLSTRSGTIYIQSGMREIGKEQALQVCAQAQTIESIRLYARGSLLYNRIGDKQAFQGSRRKAGGIVMK